MRILTFGFFSLCSLWFILNQQNFYNFRQELDTKNEVRLEANQNNISGEQDGREAYHKRNVG